MNKLFRICRAYSIDLPQSYELVLELYSDDTCAYYLADNDRQTIFFLDNADTTELELPDVVSTEHLSKSSLTFIFFLNPLSSDQIFTALQNYNCTDNTGDILNTSHLIAQLPNPHIARLRQF